MPVRELTVAHKTESLLVIGDGHIVSVPLYHCSRIISCRDCVSFQDPYCVWDISNHECKSTTSAKTHHATSDNFIQNMNLDKDAGTLCRKYGDAGNRIDQQQRPVVIPSTRGTVSSVAKTPHISYPDNEITLTSYDSSDLKNTIIGK